MPLGSLLEAGIKVWRTSNGCYVTEGIDGRLPARFISSVIRLDDLTRLWPTEDAVVNLAIQRDQVDGQYRDTDKIEEECIALANTLRSSRRAEDTTRNIAQNAVDEITAARLGEEAPDQSLALHLAQMSVEVPVQDEEQVTPGAENVAAEKPLSPSTSEADDLKQPATPEPMEAERSPIASEPDWSPAEVWEYASERPGLLQTAKEEMRQAGLDPDYKLTEEQIQEYVLSQSVQSREKRH